MQQDFVRMKLSRNKQNTPLVFMDQGGGMNSPIKKSDLAVYFVFKSSSALPLPLNNLRILLSVLIGWLVLILVNMSHMRLYMAEALRPGLRWLGREMARGIIGRLPGHRDIR